MLALTVYEAEVCECGFHSSVTQDAQTLYTIDTGICPVCADVAALRRAHAAEDEKAEKALGDKAPPETPRPGDGRRSSVRLITEEEAEAMRAAQPAKEAAP